MSQVGTRGQSDYTLAESSLSAQGIVTSVHESTYSAGSIHAGEKGSPMPSPYVEAVCIEDCLMASQTSFLSVLDPARKMHLCQNNGLLTGWRTLLWKHIVRPVVHCLQLLNVIPLEQWLLLMQH